MNVWKKHPQMLDIKVLPQTTILVKKGRRASAFTVQNNSMESVGYKIKTTRPKDYVVRPNMGMIIPMQQVEIEVTLSEHAVPDSSHKFLVEVYPFDWRKSVADFRQHLRTASPRPAWTSRIGILYEEEKTVEVPTEGTNAVAMGLARLCLLLGVLHLFYRFFE